jgi:hypothetical protein
MNEWMIDEDGSLYKNDKRSAFLPFTELPGRVSTPLELAIYLAGDKVEQEMLQKHGWRVLPHRRIQLRRALRCCPLSRRRALRRL